MKGNDAAEPGADEVDHHGGNGWADQGASPAQRNPDHKLRAELEVAEIGRDDIVVSRIGKAGERGDDGRTNEEQGFDPRGADAAVAATLLILPDRDEQPAEIAAHEDPAGGGHGDQKGAGDPEPTLHGDVERVEVRQSAAGSGEVAAGIDHLHEDDRQNQGDHRDIQRRHFRSEAQPGDEPGGCGSHKRSADHRGGDDGRGEIVLRDGEAERVSTDAEEGRLSEGEDAGEAPQDVHGHRDRAIQERPDQDADGVRVQQQRPGGDERQCGNAANQQQPAFDPAALRGQSEPDRRVRGVRHGRNPRDEHAAARRQERRWRAHRGPGCCRC